MSQKKTSSRKAATELINEAIAALHENEVGSAKRWVDVKDYQQATKCCDQAIEALHKAKIYLAADQVMQPSIIVADDPRSPDTDRNNVTNEESLAWYEESIRRRSVDTEFEAAVQLLCYKVKSVGIMLNGSYGQWKEGVEGAETPVQYFQVEGDDNEAGIPYFVSPNLEAIRMRAIEIMRSNFYRDARRFVRSVIEQKNEKLRQNPATTVPK